MESSDEHSLAPPAGCRLAHGSRGSAGEGGGAAGEGGGAGDDTPSHGQKRSVEDENVAEHEKDDPGVG